MQNTLLAIGLFPLVFFSMAHLGRRLRDRWHVRVGVPYHLFCVFNSFLISASFMREIVELEVLQFIYAITTLLGASFLLNLFNRFYWEGYFQRKRQLMVPRFLMHFTMLTGMVITGLLILQWIYGVRVPHLLTGLVGSGVLLGLALQPVAVNLIAGLTVQLDKPFKPGDWLVVGERRGQVMEINWRSTRLRTLDHVYLDIPNGDLVKSTIVNLNYPVRLHADRLRVPIDYSAPPNLAREVLLRATATIAGVRSDPAPEAFLREFGESAMIFEIKYWLEEDGDIDRVSDTIRTNCWYELKRADISIPLAIRTLRFEHKEPPSDPVHAIAEILGRTPVFGVLTKAQREQLVTGARTVLFGRGERLFKQGDGGTDLFLLLTGGADVLLDHDGKTSRVGVARAEDCLGEMGMLTGEKRSATVLVTQDCEAVIIPRERMAELLRESPEVAEKLSEILSLRQLEAEVILAEEASLANRLAAGQSTSQTADSLLRRIKRFFSI